QLPRYRRSLLVDLWTRRLTSCSSLLHRAPFVGRFATKPTKEWPDLFPLSRYVTRKGSGDGRHSPGERECSVQYSSRDGGKRGLLWLGSAKSVSRASSETVSRSLA